MSSGEQNLITRLRLLPAVLGIGAALVMAGCSAGQITQTSTQVPAVNGSMGSVKQIAVRDVQLAYPTGKRYYSKGDSAAVTMTIANSGEASDKLTGITSPQFTSGGQIVGDATIPGHHAITAKATAVSPLTTTATSTSSTATSTTGTSTSGSSSAATSTSASSSSSTAASATTTTAVSSDANVPVGTIQVQLVGLNLDKLQAGQTVQITLTFADGGDLTLTVPIAADTSPRVDN